MKGRTMKHITGLIALGAAVAWIGWIALTVMAIAEPSIERAALWIVVTPIMALLGASTIWLADRSAVSA
jgi:hypothetical protein